MQSIDLARSQGVGDLYTSKDETPTQPLPSDPNGKYVLTQPGSISSHAVNVAHLNHCVICATVDIRALESLCHMRDSRHSRT